MHLNENIRRFSKAYYDKLHRKFELIGHVPSNGVRESNSLVATLAMVGVLLMPLRKVVITPISVAPVPAKSRSNPMKVARALLGILRVPWFEQKITIGSSVASRRAIVKNERRLKNESKNQSSGQARRLRVRGLKEIYAKL